ncbi:glycosyltransferase [Nonomuraea sp. GTA35]|uniref:glycosyltransferase n=1 Tax=Nonomuraea sp. GTA35 TaxID=1676746 RepID=UPI0035C1708F
MVAFDCPTGPKDVLTDGVDGLLVPPRDVDAPAAALNRVIADRDLRLRMGRAARRTSQAYGPEQVMPLWEDLFSELAAGERVTDHFWHGRRPHTPRRFGAMSRKRFTFPAFPAT